MRTHTYTHTFAEENDSKKSGTPAALSLKVGQVINYSYSQHNHDNTGPQPRALMHARLFN